jgi:hypothetical protein
MGSPKLILLKLKTMADTEKHNYTIEEVLEFIKNKKDVGILCQAWRDVPKMEYVGTDMLPKYVLQNINKFASYMGAL